MKKMECLHFFDYEKGSNCINALAAVKQVYDDNHFTIKAVVNEKKDMIIKKIIRLALHDRSILYNNGTNLGGNHVR